MIPRALAAGLLGSLLLGNALAAETPHPETIGQVHVTRLDVFDPSVKGEDWWPFRLANKLHIVTKEAVIRRELLLKTGDRWDPLKAIESERILRANGSFRRVEIKPVRTKESLDLSVLTQDSWTTNLELSVGTEGGDNFVAYGAKEDNLLGLGKSIAYRHSQVGETIRNDFHYADPRLLSSRYRFSALFATNLRGKSYGSDLARPFFSLETPYAVGVRWFKIIDERITYRNADELSQFTSNTRSLQTSAAQRLGRRWGLIHRLEGGWYYDRRRYTATTDTTPGSLPRDFTLSGPLLGYSWVQPRYIKEREINNIDRDEDFNLGNEFKAFAVFAGDSLGSDRDRWTFNVMDQQGLRLADGRFILAQAGATGRLAGRRYENTLLFANINLFWKARWPFKQTWVAHGEVVSGWELDKENQVVLGGNSGLRGYLNRSFAGDKSLLFNLEDRFFFPGELFHLFKLGGVVFIDAGSVVPQGSGFSFKRFHSDIGIGLRAASTRSRSGHVMRFDIAYGLDNGPGPDRWIVAVKAGQAFDLFSSSTRRVRRSPSSNLDKTAPVRFPAIR